MELGELVRYEREQLGISRSELARRADVTPTVIQRLEDGEVSGNAKTIARITDALAISPERVHRVLMGRDTEPVPPPSTPESRMEQFKRRLEAIEAFLHIQSSDAEPSVRPYVPARRMALAAH